MPGEKGTSDADVLRAGMPGRVIVVVKRRKRLLNVAARPLLGDCGAAGSVIEPIAVGVGGVVGVCVFVSADILRAISWNWLSMVGCSMMSSMVTMADEGSSPGTARRGSSRLRCAAS